MDFTYKKTFIKHGRTLTEVTDKDQTLDVYRDVTAYIQILYKQDIYHIDLMKMFHKEPLIDYSYTVELFLKERLTEFVLDRYKTDLIPYTSSLTGRYPHRIEAYDALASSDVDIAYTSITNPSLRNDAYHKDILDDLVITSEKRTFQNTLAAVNGVFHRTVNHTDDLYVVGGFFNIKNSKDTKISLYDTSTLGGHATYQVTLDMISNLNTSDIRQGVYLTLPPTVDLTNKTVFFVLDGYLHALDDTYKVVGPHTVKIDTCKLDYVFDYLHNPNTTYLHDCSGRILQNPYRDATPALPLGPTAEDEITHWIQDLYPYDNRLKAEAQVALTDYSLPPCDNSYLNTRQQALKFCYMDLDEEETLYHEVQKYCKSNAPKPVTDEEAMEYFLKEGYALLMDDPTTQTDGGAFLLEYKRPDYYKNFEGLYMTIPTSFLYSKDFLQYLLLSQHTFLIVIDNPAIYTRTYPLTHIYNPSYYQKHSEDTPRGFLRYNKHKTLPYVINTSPNHQHNLSFNFYHKNEDIYKSIFNTVSVPSPKLDPTQHTNAYLVELLEFYGP